MYTINWMKKARKQLATVGTQKAREAIVDAVSTLVDLPNAQNVKALTKHQCGYRLRVGKYRVLFDADHEIRIVEVQEVKKRDDQTY
ncbi:type II toxin-antitoxin system RelE/ParE family toxin [Pigmentiphaga sp. GD03639]|uniref:type II toxin-antitoxin system RelE family toxin n=1 Tax=Pigmentiphaga sp. GD03639 TaxID=2975354 RepID=UPI0024470C4A|nr:type II toxin-antitoxin system RelE/ParE family toxin [Pigmentiphaga sp. GD03639]MDH2235408.1 type II toxin-antitoxin system RelE/ParE family toxin [Pigmentiphaga sp. GD03639]